MKVNFTIDNCFRNPLRWGKCPMNISNMYVFGFAYSKNLSPYHIGNEYGLRFYFYKWYYTFEWDRYN